MNPRQGQSRLTGLLRLRHLRETMEAVDVEMVEERERFRRLANNGAAPRVVSAFNLYETPEPLAALVVERLGERQRILEPSAGLGRIYRAVRAQSKAPVVLVELAAQCCAELYRDIESDEAASLIQGDFLGCDAVRLGGLFDGVVMNPPFSHRQDFRHVRHAFELLEPGGRLVAIMSPGSFYRQSRADRAFREWFEQVGGVAEDLPAGSFKASGTNVETRLVTIEKDD